MITIIIVTFKSEKLIDNCINSIDSNYKIIVVENSSDIKFKTYLESKYKNVKCILTGENLGFGAANNIGILHAHTDHVLVLNPDAKLFPDTLDILETYVQTIDFAILGPHILNENCNNYENFERSKKNNELIANDDLISVDSIRGFAMLINKLKFKNEFFDENFFLYMEEIDLCKRARNDNQSLFISKKAKVTHLGGQSHDQRFNKELEISRNWHWIWSKFYYMKKHYGFIYAFKKNLKIFLTSPLKVIFFLIILKKYKMQIYLARFSGLFNAILGKKSSYRPKI